MKVIKYQFAVEVNYGTDEQPDIVKTINNKEIQCDDSVFESNYAAAMSEAYNGEVTVEDIPMTAEEARAKRDKLLEESDWTQTPDAPIDEETKTAYRAYRQALRDVPQQEGFPASIVWPEIPEKVKAAPEPVDEAVELLLSGATGEEETA